jgi:hypothetical protein
MWDWIKQLDRVLRGEATRVTDLRSKTIDIPVAGLCWVVVFGLVGAQMGWVLRPFIGLFGGQGAVVAHRDVCHWAAQFLRHQHALRSAA